MNIGDKMTYHCGSDRYVFTVIEVCTPGKVRAERAEVRGDRTEVVTLTKRTVRGKERWQVPGSSANHVYYVPGDHGEYRDPHV